MRTFSGEKLSAIGEVGRIQIRDTSIPSFYPVFSMAKPVRRMSVRPKIVLSRLKNRLADTAKAKNPKSYANIKWNVRLFYKPKISSTESPVT